ncbi:MAG: 16S rRNA (cytidine(1402)-2'-O)-methyltransferase, partial [Eubacteriales bacterium]
MSSGTLYVCATPIGNLGDITLRVLDTFKNVDYIAAEDTRHSKNLLNHYEIKKPMISYHEHNERRRTEEIIEKLRMGKNIALISDAGMPGISDPGQILIAQCREENIAIDVLPGANAAITGLVLSGLPAEKFAFIGFLPSSDGDRKKELKKLAEVEFTLIFYEAPHRLGVVLKEMSEVFGDREVAVARELTKIHQSLIRGYLGELAERFENNPPKGECCIIVEKYKRVVEKGYPLEWLEELSQLLRDGIEEKEAMKIVAKRHGISKREVYGAKIKAIS